MNKKSKVIRLIVVSIVLILLSAIVAFKISSKHHFKETGEELTITHFLNGSEEFPSGKTILVGMAAGTVFGFIDNAGLWFGMDSLDPYLPGGELTKAGFGNTYSDALGAFLATFIGYSIQKLTGVNSSPIWADSVGIVFGCLLGIAVPKMITGKS